MTKKYNNPYIEEMNHIKNKYGLTTSKLAAMIGMQNYTLYNVLRGTQNLCKRDEEKVKEFLMD